MALAETAHLAIDLSLTGNAKAGIAGVQRQLTGLNRQSGQIGQGFRTMGAGIGVAFRNIAILGVAALGGLSAGIVQMVKDGQVAAKSQKLFDNAIQASGQVSTQYVDILKKQQQALLQLTGTDDEVVADIQTRLITMKATGQQTAALTPLIIATARATGKSIETVTMAVGKGIQGNAAALGRIGIVLPKVTAATKSAAMAGLERQKLQLAANEAEAKAHGGLSKTEKKLYDHRKAVLAAAIAQQKLTDVTKKGTAAASGYDSVFGELNKRFGKVNDALSGQLETRLGALRESLANIREEAGIKLAPAITKLVGAVSGNLVPAFGSFIDRILPGIITGIDEFTALLENGGAERGIKAITDALGPMVAMLKIAAAPVQTIVSAFLKLPSQVQGVLIGAFAVNKLSGGLILGGAGQVAGGLLQRGSSRANPMYVSDVSGGGALGAAGKGGLGTVLKFVGAIGLATVALDLWQNSLVPLNEANATQTKTIGENVKAGLKDASIDVLKSQRGALIEGLTKIGGITQGLGPLQGVLFGGQIEGLKADIAAIDAELGRRKSPIAQFTRNFAVAGSPIAQFTTHLGSIASTLTKVQQELRTDFRAAVAALRDATNPADMLAAVGRLVTDIRGGVGNVAQTKATVADLTTRRDAALKAGDKATADALTKAIKQIAPLISSRQWQQAQIAQGRKIVDSNRTNAQKIKELRGIQSDLLHRQDTSAAKQVQQMIDLIAAVKGINIGNAFTPSREGDNGVGPIVPGRDPRRPGLVRPPSLPGGHPMVVQANVSVSTRDVNTSQSVRGRYGPTPSQAGAA